MSSELWLHANMCTSRQTFELLYIDKMHVRTARSPC